jgi:hypothetical protein
MSHKLFASAVYALASIGTVTLCHAQVESLDRMQAEQEKLKQLLDSKPKAYQDRFMDNSVLLTLPDEESSSQAAEGFRSYLIESRYGYNNINGTGLNPSHSSEMGLRAEYRFETQNYGEYAIQADLRQRAGQTDPNTSFLGVATQQRNGRITLRNLGLPITTRLFADTSLGDISSEITDGLTRNYRFSLGTSTVRGLSTHVYSDDFDLRAGSGQRGNLVGGPYPGFEATQGQLSWLGATKKISGSVYAGLQVSQAKDVAVQGSQTTASATTGNKATINMLAATLGYGTELVDDGDKKAKLTLLDSQSNAAEAQPSTNASSQAKGVFLEGGFKDGRYRHDMGAYWTLPSLHFGDYTAAQATQKGAYWRVDYHGSQLHWGAGLDVEQQTPVAETLQQASQRITLSATAQQVYGRDTTLGMNVNATQTRLLNGGSNSYINNSTSGNNDAGYGSNSYYFNAFYQTRFIDLGRSRFSATLRRNQTLVTDGSTATGEELAWEHDWVTGRYETMRPEFVTTLGMARDHSQGDTQIYPTAGMVFRYWASADWSMGGNLMYSARNGNLSTSRGLAGSLSLDKSFSNGWHLGAIASANQAVVKTDVASFGSPITTPLSTRSQEKSIYFYLRYEGNSGKPYEVLGLRSNNSTGTGNVTGVVFFDTNSDKLQQYEEIGVPNVEIYLDGRYHQTTNKEGKFEYPSVATGRHQLTLKLESLPLPWGLGADKGVVEIDVPLRGQVNVSMPIVKMIN